MRPDGRQPDELRPIKMTPNFITYPEGSVLYEQGLTQVLCCASIEDTIPRWMQIQGSTGRWITAEGHPFTPSTLTTLLEFTQKAIIELIAAQQKALKS